MRQKGRIPRTNMAIIILSLGVIGGILIIYPILNKPIGIDLYGLILVLLVIILVLLDFAGVDVPKAIRGIRMMEKKK